MSDAACLTARNEAVRKVVILLAAKNYRDLELLTASIRLTSEQIESAVRGYGRTIIPLPSNGVGLIDYVAIQNARSPAWSVYVPLFTQEEGRSDLSVDLTLIETEPSSFAIELNDLRVL
jgi:hypothetical protein